MPGDGPIPKRSVERRRRNKVAVSTVAAVAAVVIPSTPDGLHPIAARWFDSLKTSGQSRFYEDSDWAAAEYTAHAITRTIVAKRFSAISFSATWAAMGELLTTEGARRRARLEIEREVPTEAAPGVTKLADFRKKAAQ